MLPKLIAFYLPQFHNIPENDKWWGNGFTEWVNVKKAKPLFTGHDQPRLPLNCNYYNLLDNSVKKEQVRLAKQYGLDGFCYYHYWFNGKLLLEKPMEQMLEDITIDFPFCISWANEAWTKSWVNENKILIEQKYGREKEWINHYNYLRKFFLDNRYIKVENKPLLVIYRPQAIECLAEMVCCWNNLAKQDGFSGIELISQTKPNDKKVINKMSGIMDAFINFQPSTAVGLLNMNNRTGMVQSVIKYCHRINNKIEKVLGFDLIKQFKIGKGQSLEIYDYSRVWDFIISNEYSEKDILGAFTSWDNTPRKKNNGSIINGDPVLFCKYMKRLIELAKNRNDKFIFINAWNEWAEGAILEPDNIHQYGYLKALKESKVGD